MRNSTNNELCNVLFFNSAAIPADNLGPGTSILWGIVWNIVKHWFKNSIDTFRFLTRHFGCAGFARFRWPQKVSKVNVKKNHPGRNSGRRFSKCIQPGALGSRIKSFTLLGIRMVALEQRQHFRHVFHKMDHLLHRAGAPFFQAKS